MLFLQDPTNKNIVAYKAPSPRALAPPIAAYLTRNPQASSVQALMGLICYQGTRRHNTILGGCNLSVLIVNSV